MKRIGSVIATIIIFGLMLSLTGCQKSSTVSASADSRKARLIAEENRHINKQVEKLNKQLNAATTNLEQCKQQQSTLAADKQQSDLLTQENQQLKNSLNEATANTQSLSEQLKECQKKMSSPDSQRVKEMAAELEKTKKEAEESVNFVMTTVRDTYEKRHGAP